jgi:hypothetical protein
MSQTEGRDVVERGAAAVYARTSRRGFLAKMSGFLAALGLGEIGLAKAAAADPLCCIGTSCKSLGLRCACDRGTRRLCPQGWQYTGYTWGCCLSGDRLYLCSDCVSSRSGGFCVCGCRTDQNCTATMTQLAAERIPVSSLG